jgi:hypothetical protein
MKHPFLPATVPMLVCVALCAVATSQAIAQSAGNPKGTVAPRSGDAQKAPAVRPPTTGFGDSGKIITDESTARARTQTSNPPASFGAGKATRDGEPGRPSSGAPAGGADRSAKPAPQ